MEDIKTEITKLLSLHTTTAYIKGSCGELVDSFMAIDSDSFSKISEEIYKKYIKNLQHNKDTTVGLWATDRPDMIPYELKEKYFFKIEYSELSA